MKIQAAGSRGSRVFQIDARLRSRVMSALDRMDRVMLRVNRENFGTKWPVFQLSACGMAVLAGRMLKESGHPAVGAALDACGLGFAALGVRTAAVQK